MWLLLGLSAQPHSFKIVDISHQLHDMTCIIFQYFLSLSNKIMLFKNRINLEVVLRWQKNRTGRSLSLPQIHQKNIWMLSKFHRTTSECRQRISGTQKSSPLSSKGGRKSIKDKKRDKRGRDGAPSREGSLKKDRSFQTPGNSLTAESMASLGTAEG